MLDFIKREQIINNLITLLFELGKFSNFNENYVLFRNFLFAELFKNDAVEIWNAKSEYLPNTQRITMQIYECNNYYYFEMFHKTWNGSTYIDSKKYLFQLTKNNTFKKILAPRSYHFDFFDNAKALFSQTTKNRTKK